MNMKRKGKIRQAVRRVSNKKISKEDKMESIFQ
jgi:hypothetical protein